MKKLMHLIVLSCQRASFLVEKSNTKTLSFIERVQLSWHLSMCDKCTAFKKQSLYIEQLLKKEQVSISKLKEYKLSDQSKKRMSEVLEKEQNN